MWLDRTLAWIFPSLLLRGTPWYQLWHAKEKNDFRLVARIVYGVVGIAYVAHYLFLDRAMHLQPLEFWFRFRMSMFGLSWATAAFYFVPTLYRTKFFRLPAMLT